MASTETPTTDLYFEAHVTIEPVMDEIRLEKLKAVADRCGFRVADLMMVKRKETPKRSPYDTFCTTRSKDYDDIVSRVEELIYSIVPMGYKVWRYKIENTLVDVRLPKI